MDANDNSTATRRPTGLSAVEELVESIRQLIDDRNLGVGDGLPSERELCEQFSTSRNTVREAMRMLKAYGVVDVRPKVGAVIIDKRMERVFDLFSFNTIEVSLRTFLDIQGFRGLMEVGSVDRMMDRVTEQDVDDLALLNAAMRRAGDVHEASERDFQFHLRLVAILDNNAVREVYRIMKPVILKIMLLGKTRRDFSRTTFDQHEAIIDGLSSRDRIGFQYAAKSHLDFGLEQFGATERETSPLRRSWPSGDAAGRTT